MSSSEISTPVRALHLPFFSTNANDVTNGEGDDGRCVFVSQAPDDHSTTLSHAKLWKTQPFALQSEH